MNTQGYCMRVSACIDSVRDFTCFTKKFRNLYLHACVYEMQLHACIVHSQSHAKTGNILRNLYDDACLIVS